MARGEDEGGPDVPGQPLRVDKWLWAARFYKTRALAAEAIDAGRVVVNGERAKRARPLKPGDEIRARLGPYEHHVIVRALSGRRGPAREAALLYDETEASKAARAALAVQMRASAPAFGHEQGRPTKKDRREISRFREERGG